MHDNYDAAVGQPSVPTLSRILLLHGPFTNSHASWACPHGSALQFLHHWYRELAGLLATS